MNSNKEQKDMFINGEGDAWYSRNSNLDIESRVINDPILKLMDTLGVKPSSVLEVGSAEGWRLNEIYNRHGSACTGFDPSSKAIEAGKKLYPNIKLNVATADEIPHDDDSQDFIIIGFCLYLCDRGELFKIANEIDRVLKDDGYLIILDFYTKTPYKNEYSHKEGVFSYKMNYSNMFTWNPSYQLLIQQVMNHDLSGYISNKDDQISVSCIRKSSEEAYMKTPEYTV